MSKQKTLPEVIYPPGKTTFTRDQALTPRCGPLFTSRHLQSHWMPACVKQGGLLNITCGSHGGGRPLRITCHWPVRLRDREGLVSRWLGLTRAQIRRHDKQHGCFCQHFLPQDCQELSSLVQHWKNLDGPNWNEHDEYVMHFIGMCQIRCVLEDHYYEKMRIQATVDEINSKKKSLTFYVIMWECVGVVGWPN